MDNSVNKLREGRFEEKKSNEPGVKNAQKKEAFKEASDVGQGVHAETIGLTENVETTGRVSEVLNNRIGEDKKGSASAKSTTSGQFDPAALRVQLLKNPPTERAMRRQVENEIKKEINYLHRKAMKMLRSPGSVNYFEMSNLMSKIRELKGILLQLSKVALDHLKTLWLRYVHGIM